MVNQQMLTVSYISYFLFFSVLCSSNALTNRSLIQNSKPEIGTVLTKCKVGDSKINGMCYASCGANVTSQNRMNCISNCPKSYYRASYNNNCLACDQRVKTVSVTPDCGFHKPCGNCDINAGGILYYCPLRGKTNWCC